MGDARACETSPSGQDRVLGRQIAVVEVVALHQRRRCTTKFLGGTLIGVPTTRPRYQVTETPEVARALDRAAKRWPGEPRSRLLVRLVEAGGDSLADDERAREAQHRAAVLAGAGRYPEAFGPDYLVELRADWPA